MLAGGAAWAVLVACSDEDAGSARPAVLTTVPSVEEVLSGLQELSFADFIAESYAARLRRDPETVVGLGLTDRLPVQSDELTDISPAFVRDGFRLDEGILERLRGYDRGRLSPADRLSYDVYAWILDNRLRQRAFVDHIYPVTHMFSGIQNDVRFFFTDVHPLTDEEDAEDYVARLRRVEFKIDDAVDALERGRRAGIVLPSRMIDWALSTVNAVAGGSATIVPFYTRLSTGLGALVRDGVLSDGRRGALLSEARDTIGDRVIPAYRRLRDALTGLRGAAPGRIGVGTLPQGADYYAWQLRNHTTTDLTAAEIHAVGLREVDRIEAEIRSKFADRGYRADASIASLFAQLATDDGFVAPADVVSTYEAMIREADAVLDRAFDLRPGTDVRVIGGPTGGFYLGPSLDGTRPGAFYAQNIRPEPRFAMKTLAYHEAVPGHHFQIGIAGTLDLPLFRNIENFTGYVEGWALYAEWLALELGLYNGDPAGDLGRLQAEIFRAARLVVDTGIHAMGWTFEDATSYFVAHTGFLRQAAEGQIARYAVWPGQSTAYMTGMLRIRALRRRAEEVLGANFDLKAFHRVLLANGSVPLDILEDLVDAHIEERRAGL